MIQETKKKDNELNRLLRDVVIITFMAMLLLFLIGRFGGKVTDKITKSSCDAINEIYVEGDKPGEGFCVSSSNGIDVKK